MTRLLTQTIYQFTHDMGIAVIHWCDHQEQTPQDSSIIENF